MKEVFNLSEFESYREGNRLEVKKAEGGLPRNLWDSYSAMANTYGGVIICGVGERSDGSWYTTGLTDAGRLLKSFWDQIHDNKKVNINLLKDSDVQLYSVGKDVIMVINVPRASRNQRPVFINNDIWNGTFRRNGEGDYHCSKSEIRGMLRDEPEETSDMVILEDFSIEDLDAEAVHGYRNYHSSIRPGHVWEKLPDNQYLERIGAVALLKSDGLLHPTAAGLLMFGNEYRIVRQFPEYFLDYREVLDPNLRWTDRIQSSSGDWTGNLFDFFFRVYNKLVRDIEKPFVLNGVSRVEDTPVHKALREALANCLSNADFYMPRGIVILKEAKQIVLQNPGSIRTGKNQMIRGGISDPRNKAIMKMFNMLSIGERAGSGVPNILSVWEEKGWERPSVEEQFNPDRTILTLPLMEKTSGKNKRKKQAEKTSGKKQAKKTTLNKHLIIEFINKSNVAGTEAVADHIGLSLPRTRALISELVSEGLIKAEGEGRSRRYSIAEAKAKR